MFLYVFRCGSGKYFLQVSNDLQTAVQQQHEWTAWYPIATLPGFPELPEIAEILEISNVDTVSIVHAYTLRYMIRHGIDNVRSCYMSAALEPIQYIILLMEIAMLSHNHDLMNRATQMLICSIGDTN